MPFIQEMMNGAQKKPTAQEMAGGVPQNALQTTGHFLKDFFNPFTLPGDDLPRSTDSAQPPQNPPVQPPGIGEFLNPLSPPPGSAPAQAPPVSVNPAQLQQSAPVAPVAAPPAATAGMGAAPMGAGATPMGGNPQMLQALMARQQAMGAR